MSGFISVSFFTVVCFVFSLLLFRKSGVLPSKNWSSHAEEELVPLEQELDQSYRQPIER
nr:hypothetical protein [Seinonella peptonophila]